MSGRERREERRFGPSRVKKRTEPTRKERQRREELRAIRKPPVDDVQEAQKAVTQAKETIKQAESYSAAYGSEITWGDKTYDLGTTQGWKDYKQAIRKAKSQVRDYERQIKEYQLAKIKSEAPQPRTVTPRVPSRISEVGPPQIATPSMISELRTQGYDLPEGKTIYVSPSGQPYYYEGEIKEPEKALSKQLWEESELIEESETGKLFGIIPYSEKGVRQIGAVITGSVEQALTPILKIIPGEQPFELTESEVGFSWRDVEGTDQLDETEKKVAKLTGYAAESGARIISMAGVTYVGGVVIGASGAAVSRIPTIGGALEKGGMFLANKLNTPIGKAALLAPIAVVEGKKILELTKLEKEPIEIIAELGLDAASLYGAAIGTSRGLSYGKTIPAKVERLVKGGVTIPEEAFVPEYVREGESFPKFSEEPYPPTAKGYKEMAEAYTPEELRIAEETVPSYHATPGRLEAETPEGFITQVGKRPGEGGMFYAPAGSKHFLRLESGYSLEPGMPNIFSEPKWIYGEFPEVVETGLSKSSPELAKILEKSVGTGKIYMPAGQLGEAQAILGPGTEMARVKEGRFWADMGGKIVKIDRYLPTQLAKAVKVETVKIESLETLLSKQAATESYLYGPQRTTYLPILSGPSMLKKADSSLKKIEVTPTSPSKVSKISASLTSSLKVADSSLLKISTDISISRVTTPKSYPSEPSYPKPRYTIPEPSIPSYPEPPSTPPSYPPSRPSLIPEPSIPSYPEPSYMPPSGPELSYAPPYEPTRQRKKKKPKDRGKKKRKGVYELRVEFKEPEKLFKEPKIPGFETGTKKKKGLKVF